MKTRTRLFGSILAAAFALAPLASYAAPGAAERAIQALNSMKRPRDMKVTVILIPLLTKAVQDAGADLQKQTGIKLEFIEKGVLTIHDDIMREKVSKLGAFDVILGIPMWTGNFAAAGLILPMDDWAKKYDPELGDYMANTTEHAMFGGKLYGLMADGDAHTYYMRRDVVEHPEEKAAFRAKHGRDPGCPNTWQEHLDLISFFHRKKGQKLMGAVLDKDFDGTVEARVRGRNFLNWFVRYHSKGVLPFDDKMKPLLNTPQGVQATKEFAEVYKYMSPAATGWDSAQLLPHYGLGNAFSTIHFGGTAKFIEHPEKSKVRGKNMYCQMPGSVVDGRLIRRTNNAGAFAYYVNRYSKNPNVAYLVSQWLASPEIGTKITMHRASFFEPVRKSQFDPNRYRKDMEATYHPGFVATQEKQLQIVAPLVSLPGSNEYHDKLDIRLHEVLLGRLSPEEAMKKASEAWEQVTDDEGRASQIKAWAAQKKLFPKVDSPQ